MVTARVIKQMSLPLFLAERVRPAQPTKRPGRRPPRPRPRPPRLQPRPPIRPPGMLYAQLSYYHVINAFNLLVYIYHVR